MRVNLPCKGRNGMETESDNEDTVLELNSILDLEGIFSVLICY